MQDISQTSAMHVPLCGTRRTVLQALPFIRSLDPAKRADVPGAVFHDLMNTGLAGTRVK
jgi:hypothetical protein